MVNTKELANKHWNEGHDFLKKEEYEKAYIAFDKAINNDYMKHNIINGNIIIFYKALCHFLSDNNQTGEAMFKEFIYQHLYIDVKFNSGNSQSIKREKEPNVFDFNKQDNSVKSIEINLNIYGGLKSFLYENIKWWKEANLNTKPNIESEKEKNKGNETKGTPVYSTKLHDLVGLDAVKYEVEKLIDMVKIRQLRKERGLDITPKTLHMVFTGNPGTGKTTVARILSEVFKDIGLLSKGHLIETDRSDIVEKYVGHTSKKMLELVESAKGGILFIDEAYALAKDDNDKDFGKEAIDTLVKMMEDNREDLVVIVAGYPMEMEKFLSSNSGLKSRFPYNIHFEDYSNDELSIVFKRLCESKGYFVSESVLQKVEKLIDTTKKADELTFGNARGVRNIFERIEINQMSRLAKLTEISNEDLQTFLEIDIV
jgi:SpoVK/Ycf46/Vps4 family AAA+-type ATPase